MEGEQELTRPSVFQTKEQPVERYSNENYQGSSKTIEHKHKRVINSLKVLCSSSHRLFVGLRFDELSLKHVSLAPWFELVAALGGGLLLHPSKCQSLPPLVFTVLPQMYFAFSFLHWFFKEVLINCTIHFMLTNKKEKKKFRLPVDVKDDGCSFLFEQFCQA